MKAVLFAYLAIMAAYGYNMALVKEVNSKAKNWVGGVNPGLFGADEDYIVGLMGWKPSGKRPSEMGHIDTSNAAPPTSFDSRQQWSNCSSIGTIQNQARCGSCWAFGCIESITDRFCIASNQQADVQLSFEDIVSCDQMDDGCEGGEAESCMSFIQNSGVVTDSCYPYTVPTCPAADQPCPPSTFVNTPGCKAGKCQDGSNWASSKHYLKSYADLSSNINVIATEIMTNGPVEACFTVYEDFLTYKSGVYKHTHGAALGGHCVKIIGWGVLSSEQYWLVANSWTTTWGDNGFFMILRGVNECGIEGDVVAGVPDLSRSGY
jgi:cathepsin B